MCVYGTPPLDGLYTRPFLRLFCRSTNFKNPTPAPLLTGRTRGDGFSDVLLRGVERLDNEGGVDSGVGGTEMAAGCDSISYMLVAAANDGADSSSTDVDSVSSM